VGVLYGNCFVDTACISQTHFQQSMATLQSYHISRVLGEDMMLLTCCWDDAALSCSRFNSIGPVSKTAAQDVTLHVHY
jgi:hypothetical protein